MSSPTSPTPAETRFHKVVDAFLGATFAQDPVWATSLGIHDFDGALDDYSDAALDRRRATTRQALSSLRTIRPETLGFDSALDLDLFRGQLTSRQIDLEEIRIWEHDPAFYPSLAAEAIHGLLKRDFAPHCDRAANATLRMQALPHLFEAAERNLKLPVPELTAIARETTAGTLGFLEQDLPPWLAECGDLALRAKADAARDGAIAALRRYQRFLEGPIKSRPAGSYVLGKDRFMRKLAADESYPGSLEELRERGQTELARLRAEFERTAHQIDPSRTARQIIGSINQQHPSAQELLPEVRRQVVRARDFVLQHEIVPIPQGEDLVVTETPPWERTLIFAALDAPGPFETRAQRGFFYVTPVGPTWPKQRQEEHLRAFDHFSIENTILHEAYPGHYVQQLYLRQAPTKIRQIWQSGAFIEGWALYCEQMALDTGFDPDPRARLVELQWALLRAARYLAGTAMHTEGMTIAEAAHFLESNVYLAPANALREAHRFAADPFVLRYQLGKLGIISLRQEVERRLGRRFSLREFHRQLLSQGALPIPLLRRALLQTIP